MISIIGGRLVCVSRRILKDFGCRMWRVYIDGLFVGQLVFVGCNGIVMLIRLRFSVIKVYIVVCSLQ